MPKPTISAAGGALAARGRSKRSPVARDASKASDASLLALLPKIVAADRSWNESFDALEVAEKALKKKCPPRPSEPKFISGPAEMEIRDAAKKYSPTNTPEMIAYKARLQRWEKRFSALAGKCGVRAAERRRDRGFDRVAALREKIIAIRAKSLSGLYFKAVYAGRFPEEYDADVAISIVRDLIEMRKREIASG